MHFPFRSGMNLLINPTTVSLNSKLIDNGEILDNQRHWSFSIALINQTEFSYEGNYSDPTHPLFNSPSYYNGGMCYVKQLSGRKYSNPAFELEYSIDETESAIDISYQVGTFEVGSDVIPKTKIKGERIVVPHFLLPAQKLHFTVSATNKNSNTSIGTCALSVYDRSLPLARITPISTFTSNPNKFIILVSLFDESPLTNVQEIALGSTSGEEGNDIVDWQVLNTSSINTPPPGSELGLYAFPRVSIKFITVQSFIFRVVVS